MIILLLHETLQDVVTLISENRLEYPVAYVALQSLGAVVCTLNNAYVKR